MVAFFEPALMCGEHREVLLAPLPARRQLWEANSAFAWKTEYEKESDGQTIYGLGANGTLLKHEEGRVSYGDMAAQTLSTEKSWHAAEWSEWCAGMDGLGALVMLAASLASQTESKL